MVDLSAIVKSLKSNFKSVSVASDRQDPTDFVSTGNLAFDLISDGGIPFGYCIEFLGKSQSGKSLLSHKIIANAQAKYDTIGVLVDRENAYTKQRGEQLGVDNNKLIIASPSDTPTITDAFLFVLSSLDEIRKQDKDTYIVVVIDSISAFGKDVSLEKSDTGRKAKATHEGLRELIPKIDSKIMLLVANQVTYKVGVMYGPNLTSSSGESMKYYSTVRFSLEDAHKMIDDSRGKEVIGNWIGVEVIKTRLGPCYRSCVIPHFYKEGVSFYGGYARLLVDRGFLRPKNVSEFNRFSQQTVLLGREQFSEWNVEAMLEKHPELLFDKYPEYNTNKGESDL
jgi:protein RecA